MRLVRILFYVLQVPIMSKDDDLQSISRVHDVTVNRRGKAHVRLELRVEDRERCSGTRANKGPWNYVAILIWSGVNDLSKNLQADLHSGCVCETYADFQAALISNQFEEQKVLHYRTSVHFAARLFLGRFVRAE